jgi:phytoene desaturase
MVSAARRGGASGTVAVVGAGPGGLATAMLLAASGLRVRVYEAGATIGGRTGRLTLESRAGRFSFDRGPTFFLMPYVLEEIFAATGRRLADYADLERLDPMYRLLLGRPGREPLRLDATQDVEEMARRIAAVEPADGPAFERFIRDNRDKLRLMEPVLRSPMRGPLDAAIAAPPSFLPHLNAHLSVAGLLAKYFKNPHVRLAVSFQSKYLGMSPVECPSLFTILPFIEYEYGIWHPRGGCHALVRAMAAACEEMGVEIRTSSPVAGLEFSGREVTGVRVAGAERAEACDHAVVNADATWALKTLVPERLRRRADGDARVDAKRYSCSTHMLYLGLAGGVDLPHHTIYVSAGYEANLRDITELGALSDDPSLYVCNPSPRDPSLAPPGHSSVYVLMPTPNTRTSAGRVDWARDAAEARRRAIEQLERRFGIRDAERRVVAEHAVTPEDWRSGTFAGPINHGATFNLAHNLGQMLHNRVPHRYPGVEGLWFVGGGTHPGSGLPVIFLSAQIAARMLCDEVGVGYAGDRSPLDRGSAPRAATPASVA